MEELKTFDELILKYGNPMGVMDQLKKDFKNEIQRWIKELQPLLDDLRKKDHALKMIPVDENEEPRKATAMLNMKDTGKKISVNADNINGQIIMLKLFFNQWSVKNE